MALLVVLGLMLVVPGIIALVQEGKDKTVGMLAGAITVLGGIAILSAYGNLLRELLLPWHSVWFKAFSLAVAVLGVVLVVRLQNRVVGTVLVTASLLICGISFSLIHW